MPIVWWNCEQIKRSSPSAILVSSQQAVLVSSLSVPCQMLNLCSFFCCFVWIFLCDTEHFGTWVVYPDLGPIGTWHPLDSFCGIDVALFWFPSQQDGSSTVVMASQHCCDYSAAVPISLHACNFLYQTLTCSKLGACLMRTHWWCKYIVGIFGNWAALAYIATLSLSPAT